MQPVGDGAWRACLAPALALLTAARCRALCGRVWPGEAPSPVSRGLGHSLRFAVAEPSR